MNSPRHTVKIGIIGDYDSGRPSHPQTNVAIGHAARYLSLEADVGWLPTPSFLQEGAPERLKQYDAVWASPGSPYTSMEGAITAIRLAREAGKPFIGT